MAKLRNLRAYVPGTNETPAGTDAAGYDTGTNNGILRKINLNVDIATQNELNEAFTTLSNAITATGTEWKEADIQLSNDLKAWAKGEELSGALHNEITAEADRAYAAEQEISAALTAWNVTVDKSEDTSSYVYTIKQGGTAVQGGTIDIAKDIFVTSADFEGTVLILHLANGQVISTDLSGLVDEYEGSEDTETKVTTTDNVISVELKDTIARVGTSEDLSTANTVYGSKAYTDAKVAAAAVEAAGDAIVSATADGKKVTVGATAKLSSAVAAAETAVQTVEGDGTYIDATQEGTAVSLDVTDKVKAVVAKVEAASADWDAAEANAKAYTDTVSAALSTAAHDEIAAEAAARSAADEFLSGKIDALSTSVNAATGDDYVAATVENNTVVVTTQDKTKGAVDKVVAASATWDAALQSIAVGTDGQFVTTMVGAKTDNSQTVAVAVVTHDLSTAVAGTSNGLAVAADAKAYVDAAVAEKNVDAEGDAYVGASAANNKVTVAATGKLTSVVDVVESTSATWNDALHAADITTGSADGTIAVKGTDVAVAGLGTAAYEAKEAFDKAGDAAALQTAIKAAVNDARFDTAATDDYADIDAIIADLVKVRAALGALKALNVTLTPAQA